MHNGVAAKRKIGLVSQLSVCNANAIESKRLTTNKISFRARDRIRIIALKVYDKPQDYLHFGDPTVSSALSSPPLSSPESFLLCFLPPEQNKTRAIRIITTYQFSKKKLDINARINKKNLGKAC